MSVGPGSYDLNKSTQMIPASKVAKDSSDFTLNNARIQELIALKQETMKLNKIISSQHFEINDPITSRSRS